MTRNLGQLYAVQHDRLDPRTLGKVLANSAVIAVAGIRHGCIVFANPAFVALFRAQQPLTDLPLADIVEDFGNDRLDVALAAAEHAPTHYFGLGQRGEQPPFDLELNLECVEPSGTPTVVAFAADVTDLHRSREQLTYLAYTDPLTGLANRALFADRLHQAMLHARRHGSVFAVLMLDLDGFKAVNDTYGHDVGDVALQLVGQRLQGSIRDGDTLARIGGDEFAVLLSQLADQQIAGRVAQRLIAALAQPLDFGAHPVSVGASIGIAVWQEHAGSIDALLAAADTAMYRAKRSGRNQFQWAVARSAKEIVAMSPLAWSTAHAIGIQVIDEQHAHLAELIERLSIDIREAIAPDAVAADMNELIRFATVSRIWKLMSCDPTFDTCSPLMLASSLRRIEPVAGLRIRSKFHLTASAVRSVPSWNFTPFRRRKT